MSRFSARNPSAPGRKSQSDRLLAERLRNLQVKQVVQTVITGGSDPDIYKEFQKFWRRHADLREAKADYVLARDSLPEMNPDP